VTPANQSKAMGRQSVALYQSSLAHADSPFAVSGDAQTLNLLLKKTTVSGGTTAYPLLLSDSSEIVIPTDCMANVLIQYRQM